MAINTSDAAKNKNTKKKQKESTEKKIVKDSAEARKSNEWKIRKKGKCVGEV